MPKSPEMKYPATSLNSRVFFSDRQRLFKGIRSFESKSRQIGKLLTVRSIRQEKVIVLSSKLRGSLIGIAEVQLGSMTISNLATLGWLQYRRSARLF
jgi:hypothetical protein